MIKVTVGWWWVIGGVWLATGFAIGMYVQQHRLGGQLAFVRRQRNTLAGNLARTGENLELTRDALRTAAAERDRLRAAVEDATSALRTLNEQPRRGLYSLPGGRS